MKPRSQAKRASSLKRKASTSEIVPEFRAENPVNPKWKTYYERLLELRDYLLSSTHSLKVDADSNTPRYSLHMADAATDSYDRDFALSILSSEQDAIFEIEQALERIRDGTYGICEMTGKPIPRERLNAIPWTRFAADAETDLERRGEVETAKLGELARVNRESTQKTSETESE